MQTSGKPRIATRLAPTPSGYLHAGNGFNMLLAHTLARREGGTVRLRIDDLDAPRVRPEYIQDIFDTLHWLGIDWDEGPRNPAEHKQHFSQELRLPQYHALIEELKDGGHLFACHCSRSQLPAGGVYPLTCCDAGHALTPQHPWRLKNPEAGKVGHLPAQLACPVIKRRDGLPAYHIATLADDVAHGINLIVRGQDLLDSSSIQQSIAQMLGLHTFTEARFVHHALLLTDEGSKLSKSAGSTSLKAWREAGKGPEELYKMVEEWLG